MITTIDTRIPVLDDTLTLAVKIWYPPQFSFGTSKSKQPQCRIIAYPGWLDNVGSFYNLAPILCERLNVVIAAVEYVFKPTSIM